MNTYRRHRFPPDIISYETIRLWCIKFGAKYASRLKRKHRGYGDTHRELSGGSSPDVIHDNSQYANNRAEQSHEAPRVRERGMPDPASRKLKSVKQTQRFLGAQAAVSNLFNLGRHKVVAGLYKYSFSSFRTLSQSTTGVKGYVH